MSHDPVYFLSFFLFFFFLYSFCFGAGNTGVQVQERLGWEEACWFFSAVFLPSRWARPVTSRNIIPRDQPALPGYPSQVPNYHTVCDTVIEEDGRRVEVEGGWRRGARRHNLNFGMIPLRRLVFGCLFFLFFVGSPLSCLGRRKTAKRLMNMKS